MFWWCIKNSIVIIAFVFLAIHFNHWWICLFAGLFVSGYHVRVETHDEDNKGNFKWNSQDK